MSDHHAAPRLLSDCGVTIDLDIARFCAEPTRAERRFLKGLAGPILDVGCGPGRAAAYLRQRGVAALGLDISARLVDLARRNGAPCVQRNVFDPVPFEGRWHEVLLLDGNIGIGGDPARMLERLRHIVRTGGRAYIEVSPTGPTCRLVVREHRAGSIGEPFAWAIVSLDGLDQLIGAAGWRCLHVHTIRDRAPGQRWRSTDRDDRLVAELERVA